MRLPASACAPPGEQTLGATGPGTRPAPGSTDFGITWNAALEAGGMLVSKEVLIEIEVETVPA